MLIVNYIIYFTDTPISGIVPTIAIFVLALSVNAQSYQVDASKSTIKWNGKKVTGEHTGQIKMKEGSFEMKNDQITKGKFVIDMSSITCTDLEGEWNDKLIGHLKSDDFFNTDKFPEAKLVINTVEGTTANGEITIRNIVQPISFEFNIEENTEDKVVVSATLNVDRTKHEVAYGWSIDNAMLSNEFTMEVKLIATK